MSEKDEKPDQEEDDGEETNGDKDRARAPEPATPRATFVSEEDRYKMRKMRAGGTSIQRIARDTGFSFRQVRKHTADIEPGRKYSEEELKGSAIEKPEEETMEETGRSDDPVTVLKNRKRREGPLLVQSWDDIVKAMQIEGQVLLALTAEAYHSGHSSVGEYVELEVLPWMRLVARIKSKIPSMRDPNEPITPDEFERILDVLAHQGKTYKEKYEHLLSLLREADASEEKDEKLDGQKSDKAPGEDKK